MPFQGTVFLRHQNGVGFYHLSYYQEIILAFDDFIDDEEERHQTRMRLGAALGLFEVTYREPPKKKNK